MKPGNRMGLIIGIIIIAFSSVILTSELSFRKKRTSKRGESCKHVGFNFYHQLIFKTQTYFLLPGTGCSYPFLNETNERGGQENLFSHQFVQ